MVGFAEGCGVVCPAGGVCGEGDGAAVVPGADVPVGGWCVEPVVTGGRVSGGSVDGQLPSP